VKRPLSFVWQNLVFAGAPDDVWATFRVQTQSYAGLSGSDKRAVMGALAGFAFSVGADFQLLRVTRSWSPQRYVESLKPAFDPRHGHQERFAEYLASHERALLSRSVVEPEVYLCVRLAPSRAQHPVDWLARQLGLTDSRGITRRRLNELVVEEERVFARVVDFLDADRATTREIQWLIARAFCRGVDEPLLDERWRPQALVVEDDEQEGGARLVPLDADVMRLCEAPINVESRGLRIESDTADSHQALLALGALPESVAFPGRQAELLFAPIEALPFGVDAVFSARWIGNDRAIALARRRLVDADHAYDEESRGEHGPTASAALRPSAARELEEYLTGPERPPLLRATIGLCVAAPTCVELERRVEQLRREYSPVLLHRPLGEQLDLFVSHLPAQRQTVPGYEDVLCCEQLGAMVPTATHAVGADVGLYIGRTLSGSSQPVLFDLTEASRTSRPPAVLCSGTLGSGKTLTAQLLAYQGFLAGSRVVSVDPKGDHRLDELVGAEHVEAVHLRPDDEQRGLLDPLRIGPPDTRADLAYAFLVDLLPAPVPAAWQTELRHAVDSIVAADGRACGEVLAILGDGNEDARDAARAISVHAGSGLLRLGFADPDSRPRDPAERDVISLRIANLTLPLPGTPRSELSSDERTGRALLRLLASYALHLMGDDWTRHKVLVLDEAWMLLGDAAGRALVQRINRLCRSQNATPILATQVLADVSELENLIGALFCFGVETEREARHALELLRMDADDSRLRAQLQGFRRGSCFMRDYEGRVAPVQIEPVDPAILHALDTTPRRSEPAAQRNGRVAVEH
jgi:hypothetical protein